MPPMSEVTRASIAPLPDDLTEAVFQRRIRTLCTLLGVRVYHTHDSRRSDPGFPDLVILGPAGVVFAELKTNRGRVRPEQREWLDDLTRAGLAAYLWRPADWLHINEVLHDLAHPDPNPTAAPVEGGDPVSVTIRHEPTVHRTTPTSTTTECCWRNVRSLPIGDRFTTNPGSVTCTGNGTGPSAAAAPGGAR